MTIGCLHALPRHRTVRGATWSAGSTGIDGRSEGDERRSAGRITNRDDDMTGTET